MRGLGVGDWKDVTYNNYCQGQIHYTLFLSPFGCFVPSSTHSSVRRGEKNEGVGGGGRGEVAEYCV